MAYTLVQGDERVVLEFAPRSTPDERTGPGPAELAAPRARCPVRPDGAGSRPTDRTSRPPRGADASGDGARTAPIAILSAASAVRPPGPACSIPPRCSSAPSLPGGPRVISARHAGHALALRRRDGARGLRGRSAASDAGLAHFMEHITFRGTAGVLPTIACGLGGDRGRRGTRNASTDRESTVYWVRLPVRHAERAFDVLGGAARGRPLLRDEDVARERDIIVEEIRSYRDDPGQYVFDLFDRDVLRRHPAGLGDRGRRGDRAARWTARASATSGRRVPAVQHGRRRRGRPGP